jgi:hypothetical protein
MLQTAESLMLHLNSKYEGHAKHEHFKRMKLKSEVWACDLKVRSEQEHAMCLAQQDHIQQQERINQQMKFAKIELELSCAHREEEEAWIRRIAMEHGLDQS